MTPEGAMKLARDHAGAASGREQARAIGAGPATAS